MEGTCRKSKNAIIQMIRGLCILCIIYIHCPNAIEYGMFSNVVWIAWRQLIVFPVATFLFISGYLFDSKKYRNYRQFLVVREGIGFLYL